MPPRAVRRGGEAVVTAIVRRVLSSKKLQPPASSLYNVAGACEAAGRFLMAKAEAADALQRPASACPASPIFGVWHPSMDGHLVKAGTDHPSPVPCGRPGHW